jgi:hypothetical protein
MPPTSAGLGDVEEKVMFWIVVDFQGRGDLCQLELCQLALAALPAPIPTTPKTKAPVTIDRPRMPMPWRSKQRRTFSRISHFPLLVPSSQEAFKEAESARFAASS